MLRSERGSNVNRPSRRGVLIGSGLVLGAAAIGAGAVVITQARSSRSAAARSLFAGSLEAARQLGALYVSTAPDDPVLSDPDAVPPGAVPPQTSDPLEWFKAAAPSEVASASSTGCEADFVEDRVVDLSGWVLPVTACELCALTEVD